MNFEDGISGMFYSLDPEVHYITLADSDYGNLFAAASLLSTLLKKSVECGQPCNTKSAAKVTDG